MINSVNQMGLQLFGKARLWLGFFTIILLLDGCKKQSQLISISGDTMGTTYSVKIIDNPAQNSVNLKSEIDSVLKMVNNQMSTYIYDSEISNFNRSNSDKWFTISAEFRDVLIKAQSISQLTKGAFDITVGPMVELWGFQNNQLSTGWNPPTNRQIEDKKRFIGFSKIIVGENSIKKIHPNVKIDLNAIAKGYGVDIVFELLTEIGFTNILVEIGGEVRCSGLNSGGKVWKVGIDKPILNALPGTNIQSIIGLNNKAMATSGDYRNYFEYNGKIYSHTINPKTGYPIENGIASVSVIAQDCSTADALATALMVMGKEGIELINTLENVEAMLIIRDTDKSFLFQSSSGWPKAE